jgi:tetratricopeptide (TPR) repeat protein
MPTLASQARQLASRHAWGEVVALLAGNPGDSATVAADLELVCLLGEALLRTGQAREARALLAEALPRFRDFGGNPTIRRARNLCGAAHFELGELDDAQVAFSRAAELAQLDGDDLLVARSSNNLGMIANIRGRYEEALGLYRVALAAYQRVGEAIGYARSLHNIAITYRDTDRLDEADEYEQRAIDGARQAGDESLVAIVMAARADVQLLRGDAPMAEATALHAATLLGQVPDPARRADALRVAGLARARNGDHARAIQRFDEAVEVASNCGAALIEAESRRARGESRRVLGDRALAREDADAALAIFRRLGAVRQEATTARWIEELG